MTIANVLTVFARRWRVVVAAALIGSLAGLVMAARMPTRYSATTSLVVSPLVINPFTNAREEVNIRTEREILGSREVARRASERLGEPLDADSYLLSHVDVAAPSGSQILQVTVQASSPEQAADAANALSEAYLEFRREGADELAQRYLDKIDEQLAELAGEPESEANAALISTLQQQRVTVMLSTAEPGRIIGAAVVPTAPSTPSKSVVMVGGTVLGVLGGCALALLRERTDPRIRSVDRLRAALDTAVVTAHAPDDQEAWEEVAEAVERVARGGDSRSRRVLLDGFGRAKNARVSRQSSAQLAEALGHSPGTDVDHGRVNGYQFEVVDRTAERSRALMVRTARACGTVVMLTSGDGRLRDVSETVARVAETGAVPIVVYLEATSSRD